MEERIQFTLNGKPLTFQVDKERKLLWVLRADLGLTGAKYGCGEGHCGACTVIVNNEAIRSCQVSVADIQGKDVMTIEGLMKDGKLHPLQRAFMEHDALQCGYCTPGMILQAYSFLHGNPRPSSSDIINVMEGNLCRCGAHSRIVLAIQSAAEEMRGGL